MPGSGCVRPVGCSSRSPRTRESAAELPCRVRPRRCRGRRFDRARCTGDCFVGLEGSMVLGEPGRGPEDVLGAPLVAVGLGGLGGLGDGRVAVGLEAGDGLGD
jgi:hypothetical protein